MTLHTFNDVDQGTSDWHDLRRGLVTASVVGQLISTSTPDASAVACTTCKSPTDKPCISAARKTPTPIKTYHDARVAATADLSPVYSVADNDTSRALTALLVAERITGWTDPTWTSDDMMRGHDCEPIARDIYSGHYHQAVEVGFMVREEDGWTLGYSPDGVVADDGLLEIKSPRSKTHLKTILANEVPATYMPQLQAGLLVTGRKWIDFCSYVGGMPLWVRRVYPDPNWFAAITAACIQFEKNAEAMTAAYRSSTAGLPTTERVVELEMVI